MYIMTLPPLSTSLLDRKLIRASTLAFGFYGKD
jgi:hypothetical protein